MAILNVTFGGAGTSGQQPSIVYIQTNDTLATVTTAGYLSGLVRENVPLSTTMIACVSTKTSPNAATSSTGFFDISVSSSIWSLSASSSTSPLSNTHIFVGNASNVATDVALSGDATLANTGAMTIANSAITNAKVSASAAIDYSKLAALTSGNILVGSAGNVATSVTPSGDVTITNAGVTAIGSNKVLSAQVSPLLRKYIAVPINLAAFLAMYDAPVQLVAAQGANTLIMMDQVQVLQTYGSAALAGGGVAAIQYDSTVHGAGVIASTTLSAATFQVTASSGYTFNPGVVVQPFTTAVNKGLYLSCLTGDFTTGTDSTFVAHVWYSVVPSV